MQQQYDTSTPPGRTPPADPARDEVYGTAYRASPVSPLMTCSA